MKQLYAIYGSSGFGREVMPLARKQLAAQSSESELVFVDDNANKNGELLNGQRVVTYDRFLAETASSRYICIAIAGSEIRERLAQRCESDGILHFSVVSPSATVLDNNIIGAGAILCGYSHVTSNAQIGRHFHANLYAYIAHDCVVGDFVTLAPGAKVNGNVVLEDHAYIGTGAIIKQGSPGNPIVIGRGAVVGMGAVVTRSVAAGATVVGNPAKPMGK